MTFIPWEQIRDEEDAKRGITEQDKAEARRVTEAYITGYRLSELRRQANVTQVELAERLGIGQSRVSAIERGDIDTLTVSSVRAYVEALGGTVRMVAHFDDTDITLRVPDIAA